MDLLTISMPDMSINTCRGRGPSLLQSYGIACGAELSEHIHIHHHRPGCPGNGSVAQAQIFVKTPGR